MSLAEANNPPKTGSLSRFNYFSSEKRDTAISAIIPKIPKWLKPEVLRMAGSPEMRQQYLAEVHQKQADYFEPTFQKQIERGKSTSEHAAILRQAIVDGKMSSLAKDAFIGMVICGVIEKPLAVILGAGIAVAGYPEWAVPLGGTFASANPTAVPYFLYRTAQEVAHHKKQLDAENKPLTEKILKLTATAIEGGIATQMNLWPFPASILATLSVPLLNRQRYHELSKICLQYHLDNATEANRRSVTIL